MSWAVSASAPAVADAFKATSLSRGACCSNASFFINCYQRVDIYITHDTLLFKHEKAEKFPKSEFKNNANFGDSGHSTGENFGEIGYFG
jgi:hypothetical protein